MQASLAWALACTAVVATASRVAFTSDVHGSVGVASDYVVHGLTRSQGQPVVQGQFYYSTDGGWRAGLAASTLNLNPGPGPTRELGLYLSRGRNIGRDWSFGLELARYEFSADSPRWSYDYSEITASLRFRERLGLTIGYSPDYSLFSRRGAAFERRTLNFAASLQHPINARLTLAAGLGHYDLSDLFGFGYNYWSASAQWSWRRLSVAATIIDTDAAASRLFGSGPAGRRVVATTSLRLR